MVANTVGNHALFGNLVAAMLAGPKISRTPSTPRTLYDVDHRFLLLGLPGGYSRANTAARY